MLYVQIGIGKVTMPALVDSGASSNFIDQGVADTLKLKLLPLKVPTKIPSANGHLMECVSYAVVPARLGSLRFQLCLRVVSSSMGIILGIHFLRYFDPCISWREGTLKIYDAVRTWMVTMCFVDNGTHSAHGWPVVVGAPEACDPDVADLLALSDRMPISAARD